MFTFSQINNMWYNEFAKITHSCVTIRYLHPPVRLLRDLGGPTQHVKAGGCSFSERSANLMNTSNRRRLSGYRQIWAFLINAYGEKCVYCHRNISTQIDHVIPYSYSKYHGVENLRPCCSWCNLLASDNVFEDFDAKYTYVRQRLKAKGNHGNMLLCSVCLLPYYSALHRSFIFCPRCYAKEYSMPQPRNRQWREWIDTLATAGIRYRAHYDLADKLYSLGIFGIPQKEKVEMLVDFAMQYYEAADLDKMLGNDMREHVRNGMLEVLF